MVNQILMVGKLAILMDVWHQAEYLLAWHWNKNFLKYAFIETQVWSLWSCTRAQWDPKEAMMSEGESIEGILGIAD